MYKIAFLDRDGVINKSIKKKKYISEVKYFKLTAGLIKSIKYLKSLNYKIVVVSNQSGVARGFFKITDVYRLHKYFRELLTKKNTNIDKIIFCPFHKDGLIKKYKKNSNLRKPKIGMFNIVNKKWKVDKKKSFMIGDQLTDMQFAKKAKIKGFLFKEKNLFTFIKNKNFIK
tara:strand:- start:66 stop:578 length:513 start_codon:yes stop_codon:yes gene_type:complete